MTLHLDTVPPELAATVAPEETALATELLARGDTSAMIVWDDAGPMAYAVIGFDADQMVTVYAARAMRGFMAKAAMVGIFGAAQIIGKPVRVHTQKVAAMAKMMGADIAIHAADMDGLPMGIFAHGV